MLVRHALVLLVWLVAPVAGCGSEGSSSAGLSTTTTSTTPTVVPTTVADPSARIEELLQQERAWYLAPGGLAVVRVGRRVREAHSGTADRDGGQITDTTTFRIASITKPIVATLVLQAVERGELSLDDRVDDIVPGLIRPDPPVTVRMLLDHTSGIFDEGNDGDPVADAAPLTDPALQAEVAELTERVRRRRAGDRVGSADDRARRDERPLLRAGRGLSLQQHQLRARGGRAAGGDRRDARRPAAHPGHGTAGADARQPSRRPNSRRLRSAATARTTVRSSTSTDDLVWFGNGGHGGIVSTAEELLTIIQAIVAGELVGDELLADMKTPTLQSDGSYGLGLGPMDLSCGTFYGHGGAVNGTVSIALASDDGTSGAVVALNLLNDQDPRLPALADDVMCGALAG